MTTEYLCPKCGHDEWSVWREHVIYENLKLGKVQADGMYVENDSQFGETTRTGDFEEIQCDACGVEAPPDFPLWPKKESN